MKSGDMVMLKPGGVRHQEFVGHVYELGRSVTPLEAAMAGGGCETHWLFNPSVRTKEGNHLGWGESRLQKIEKPGDDEVDVHSFRVAFNPLDHEQSK